MKAWKVVLWSFVAFVAVILAQLPFSTSRGADYTRSQDVVTSVDGPKAAVDKLELEDIAIYAILNKLKDANASTTAPSSPNEGEFWFDTGNSALKQYYASTWTTVWSYADTTTVNWRGEINSIGGTISNLQADTLTANYGTITDAHVQAATLGSATIGTVTTSNWSQDTATFNTINSNSAAITTVTVNNDITVNGDVVLTTPDKAFYFRSTNLAAKASSTILYDGTPTTSGNAPSYNATTGVFTIQVAGIYVVNVHIGQISMVCDGGNNYDSSYSVYLYINGAVEQHSRVGVSRYTGIATSYQNASLVSINNFSVDDTVRVYVDYDGNTNVSATVFGDSTGALNNITLLRIF